MNDSLELVESMLADGRAEDVLAALDKPRPPEEAPRAMRLKGDALAALERSAEAGASYLSAVELALHAPHSELDGGHRVLVEVILGAVRGLVATQGASLADGRLMPLLDEATEVFQDLPGIYVARGLAYQWAGRLENACDEFHYATSLDEDDAEAWEALGDAAMAIEEYRVAIDAFDAAADLDPNSSDLLYRMGQAALADGDVVAASKAFEEGLGLAPGDVPLLIGHAVSALATDDFEAALDDGNAVLAAEPDNPQGLALVAEAHLRLDGPDEAMPFYDRWVALESDNVDARLQRANALMAKNQLAGARDDFAAAHALAPDDERTVLGQALVLASSGEFEACDQLARTFLKANPESDSAALLVSQTLAYRGDPAAAILVLDEAIEQNPDVALLYHSRAEMRYALNHVTLAWRDVEWALDLDPELAAAFVLRATMMLEEGEMDDDTLADSLEDLDAALEIDPSLGMAYAWRGRAHSLKGDRRAAESDWRDAEAHLPPGHPLRATIRTWQRAGG